jgi:epoxyqueuosine reductase
MSLTSRAVKAKAAEVGFDLCGIARADRHPRLARLADWIASGYAGDMHYLVNSLDERVDPTAVLHSARTVVSLACTYNAGPPAAGEHATAAIARYARGDDYHDVLRERAGRLLRWMAEEAGAGFEAFSCVDNGPVQERVFAEQAGLGWIGKNTCVINPTFGSWILLAEILTNVDLDVDRASVDQCGTCTRCVDACPTGAFVEPYTLDATRCLSYLTIERRTPVPRDLRPAINDHILGCDICQDVCPWNRRAVLTADPVWAPRAPFGSARVAELCGMPDDDWRALLKGSAMRRAGLRRIRRSLAYAAAQLAAAEASSALDALASQPSAGDQDVAEAIEWARAWVSDRDGVGDR